MDRPCQCLLTILHHQAGGVGLEWTHALLPWIQDGTLQPRAKKMNKLKSEYRIQK